MSPSWPAEALKAQALCAKSYSLNNLHKHGSKGFDLCNTTDCQVYYGTNSSTEYSDAAVEAVEGLFVMYDGKICQTYYHASSGGYTEDVRNIWGKDIPYLKAVEDTYLESTRPFSFTADLDQISWILQTKGYVTKDVTDVYVSKYSDVGNVLALTVELEDGTTKTFTGDRARTALNSPTLGFTVCSHRYTINGGSPEESININGVQVSINGLYAQGDGKKAKKVDLDDGLMALTADGLEDITITKPEKVENTDGKYTITGTGSGHNIGLSQEGAKSMANLGFTFEEIIAFYFTGAQVDYYDPN
jgi:stage II sporulation protein D